MSIEALALITLLRHIDEASNQPNPHEYTLWAAKEAKFRTQPLQTLMDLAYAEFSEYKGRQVFLDDIDYVGMDPFDDFPTRRIIATCKLQAVVVGNLNFHVEQTGGFLNWYSKVAPVETDWKVLEHLSRALNTPVGYTVQGIIRTARLSLARLYNEKLRNSETEAELEDDLNLLSIGYRLERVRWLLEVENLFRSKIPRLSPPP